MAFKSIRFSIYETISKAVSIPISKGYEIRNCDRQASVSSYSRI